MREMIKDKRLLKRAKGYQSMVAGCEKLVADMTHDELVREVCNNIDTFERLDESTHRQAQMINLWRIGKK